MSRIVKRVYSICIPERDNAKKDIGFAQTRTLVLQLT